MRAAARRIAIHQVSLLSHAACASMSTTATTTTTRDRGDRYGPTEWAQLTRRQIKRSVVGIHVVWVDSLVECDEFSDMHCVSGVPNPIDAETIRVVQSLFFSHVESRVTNVQSPLKSHSHPCHQRCSSVVTLLVQIVYTVSTEKRRGQ